MPKKSASQIEIEWNTGPKMAKIKTNTIRREEKKQTVLTAHYR